ncbi:Protein of unknown function [Cotesia congregata]|uniref:Uncharacterized protein n=1 Tax=Cotesia congregata TaxID=51543 RepID=A0A8J2MI57_COTCN|nr:Protein of unknown function [Cotesia congregata]
MNHLMIQRFYLKKKQDYYVSTPVNLKNQPTLVVRLSDIRKSYDSTRTDSTQSESPAPSIPSKLLEMFDSRSTESSFTSNLQKSNFLNLETNNSINNSPIQLSNNNLPENEKSTYSADVSFNEASNNSVKQNVEESQLETTQSENSKVSNNNDPDFDSDSSGVAKSNDSNKNDDSKIASINKSSSFEAIIPFHPCENVVNADKDDNYDNNNRKKIRQHSRKRHAKVLTAENSDIENSSRKVGFSKPKSSTKKRKYTSDVESDRTPTQSADQNKISRNTWLPAEINCLIKYFGRLETVQKTPNIATCQKLIRKYDALKNRTAIQVRAQVDNYRRAAERKERYRKKKNEGKSSKSLSD